MKNDCSLDFSNGTLELQRKRLTCTDRDGHPLMYKVQVYKEVELPPGEEVTVAGRVPKAAANLQGVVEGHGEGVLVAASLNQPDQKGHISLCCINLTEQPVRLAAGAIVGKWHRIEEKDVREELTDTEWNPEDCSTGGSPGNSYGMEPRCEVPAMSTGQDWHFGGICQGKSHGHRLEC